MSNKIILKGIAWDHPRGYQPLRATSKAFSEQNQEISIQWDVRSLKEFGDTPIEDLMETYDLITVDHPYMGQAHANKLLLPLEKKISEKILQILEQQSIGPSFNSYRYMGHLYALPIDAAALVAASRDDLVKELKIGLPMTRADLFRLYKKVPDRQSIAWPLCPTDLWCTFLTLCAQDMGRDFIKDYTINEKAGSSVLNEIKQHLEHLHPDSLNWNPIQILDAMASGDEILYSPFLFGYVNYSQTGFARKTVSFHNSPTGAKNGVSTILGGVGLAVSNKCEHPDEAVSYVVYTAMGNVQKGIYAKNGGQPGNLIAWQDEDNNNRSLDFFKNTLQTMENVYVRPQHPGWNRFQEQGADLLHLGLISDVESSKIMKDLNQLYESTV
ncbi:extracellular solute-binding protein [Flagellimonas aequoris]|uniref:Extracellular solute-binding protein n=1 Tax=Flagellimonas aequoris TaxID=2306997 RepID=A0A418N8Q6_9FLAO|nr:extracellular solute-binding protein [Allomuricauda aequoris]RIV71531.1 extracellular solute-binding protein [Allomuricauda aequoris]TXK03096.1 extracellular solute-binding protein [Allomuricauda aequoris]